MNLTNLRTSVLKNRWRVLAAVSFVLIAGFGIEFYYRNYVNPPISDDAKILPLTISEDTSTISGQVYFSSLSSASFPEELPVYQVESLDNAFVDSEMIEIASRFGFTEEPERLTLQDGREDFLFFKGGETLSVSSHPRALSFTTDPSGGGEGEIYDQSVAVEEAEKFLAEKELTVVDLVSFSVHYWAWGGNVYIEAESVSEADFVEVSFVCLVDKTPLVSDAEGVASAKVTFNRASEVTAFSFTYLDTSFTQSKTVKLLSYGDAVDALLENGLVVWTREPGEMSGWAEAPSRLHYFTPRSVELIYYQDKESSLLYPVFMFEGKGVSAYGDGVNAIVYLSAVSPKYIKSE